MHAARIALFGALAVVGLGCEDEPVRVVGDDPSEDPIAGLEARWLARFAAGDADFAHVFRASEGLGPRYVQRSCESCHAEDGRGPGVVTRLMAPSGDLERGHIVRPAAVEGHAPDRVPSRVPRAVRMPPAVFGRGYLEAIDVAAIERQETRQESLRVSGRVARVPMRSRLAQPPFHALSPGGAHVGRFGLRSQFATLDDFVANAYRDDMGLSSPQRPESDDDGRPDVDADTVHRAADYVRLLAIPRREVDPSAPPASFEGAGCAACHVPSMPTRADYPIAALAGINAPVFTDLLVHDMGASLAELAERSGDNEIASAREWRTAPLIGLRHLRAYLHDGRAATVDDAIRRHDGEARFARDAYLALPEAERGSLLRYVEAL